MKRMLMLASVASMIDQFNMPNIRLLQEMGYEVHVACNFKKGSTCTEEKIIKLKNTLKDMGVPYYQIDFDRNVIKINDDLKAYKQVLKLVEQYQYEFIHCHSPIGGVIGRLVGHKTHTKVIYTAHGFHFYKGAPIYNWLLFYPIEKYLSRYTDILITINYEDYYRAKKKFYAKRVVFVPGVGIDINKIQRCLVDRNVKRKELGINKADIVVLSVGELSKRKNHKVVIKALGKIENQNIRYLICGIGKLEAKLRKLVEKLNLEDQVMFMGFRTDIVEICKCSDIFVFPSLQEGLPVALMEAMACGLPCIVSNIRGNVDLIENKVNGILSGVNKIEDYEQALAYLSNEVEVRAQMSENNMKCIKEYSLSMVGNIMKKLYSYDF